MIADRVGDEVAPPRWSRATATASAWNKPPRRWPRRCARCSSWRCRRKACGLRRTVHDAAHLCARRADHREHRHDGRPRSSAGPRLGARRSRNGRRQTGGGAHRIGDPCRHRHELPRPTPSEARNLAEQRGLLEAIQPSLLMSHLSCADTPDHPMIRKQLNGFRAVRVLLPNITRLACQFGWHFPRRRRSLRSGAAGNRALRRSRGQGRADLGPWRPSRPRCCRCATSSATTPSATVQRKRACVEPCCDPRRRLCRRLPSRGRLVGRATGSTRLCAR